jgi:alpha-ketoglutarate-dependent taurine dioxygenase
MNDQQAKQSNQLKPSSIRRKTMTIAATELVQAKQSQHPLPLILEPMVDGVDLVAWVDSQRSQLEAHLLTHGGILFRNFKVEVATFEQLIQTISGELLSYSYRSTPRSQVSGNIYTSTEYPADQTIPLHNEMSYTSTYPLKIWFSCFQVAEQGGETPIADSRNVLNRISPRIREQFQDRQVMYVRNYGNGLDLPWQTVFQTTDKHTVEDYCRQADIDFEWQQERLRTCQVCPAIVTHPKTGEAVWFNQAHLFHISSLKPEVQKFLRSTLSEAEFPRNAYYGDGSPIATEDLEEIRAVYEQEAVIFPWQEGDVLMLDNLLVAHGRRPFVGSRKVLTGMAEPVR